MYGQEPGGVKASGERYGIEDVNGDFVQLKADGPWYLIAQTGVETLGPNQGTEPRTAVIDLDRHLAVVAGN